MFSFFFSITTKNLTSTAATIRSRTPTAQVLIKVWFVSYSFPFFPRSLFLFYSWSKIGQRSHSELGDFTQQFHGSACSTHDAHVTQHSLLPNLWTDLALNLSSDWLEGIVAGKPHLWSENSSFSLSTGLVRLWNSGRLWATSALSKMSKWKRKSAVRHLWSCLSRPSRERALRQNANYKTEDAAGCCKTI